MNIIIDNSLTDKQLQDIKSLEALCNKTDNSDFGLFTEPELNEYPDMPCFFMIYDTEKTGLLAFLSLFAPGDGTAEVSACTHPAHRQKGYFHTLCNKAREISADYDIEAFSFAISGTQQNALNVLAKYGAVLSNTEYLLRYERNNPNSFTTPTVLESTTAPDTAGKDLRHYKLTPAAPSTLKIYTDIFAAAFGYPYEAAKGFIDDILSSDADIRVFSFTDTWADKLVGCCFAEISDNRVMPFGICIHPDAQGQRLGQHMVSSLINDYLLKYNKPILLQVSGSNENALHIYRKLGFKTASQVDYFCLDVV